METHNYHYSLVIILAIIIGALLLTSCTPTAVNSPEYFGDTYLGHYEITGSISNTWNNIPTLVQDHHYSVGHGVFRANKAEILFSYDLEINPYEQPFSVTSRGQILTREINEHPGMISISGLIQFDNGFRAHYIYHYDYTQTTRRFTVLADNVYIMFRLVPSTRR